jgi:hypothetical protein
MKKGVVNIFTKDLLSSTYEQRERERERLKQTKVEIATGHKSVNFWNWF